MFREIFNPPIVQKELFEGWTDSFDRLMAYQKSKKINIVSEATRNVPITLSV